MEVLPDQARIFLFGSLSDNATRQNCAAVAMTSPTGCL
jgi:hypothetical protein